MATLKSPRRRACACLSPANVLLAFLVCVYFGTGCAFYMTVEGWNGYEAMYFLMVTASTVGYGDMNPTSGVQGTSASLTGSRIFTVVYIFFGISPCRHQPPTANAAPQPPSPLLSASRQPLPPSSAAPPPANPFEQRPPRHGSTPGGVT